MRTDREQALKLRLGGKSYNEITKILGVPKSTLSGWFSDLALSATARERLEKRMRAASFRGLLRRNKNQTRLAIRRMKLAHSEAKKEIGRITPRELKLLGAALYWAEGYKRPKFRGGRKLTFHSVSLTNSDPFLVAVFLRFLRIVCGVPDTRITANVRIYKHMSENKTIEYWQEITKIPIENFKKTYYGVSKSSQGKRPFNRLPYGTMLIRVNNTNLFHKIMGWIDGLTRF